MRCYEARVFRERRWLLIYVPKIDSVTQARSWAEAAVMARELIAVWEGVPPYSFKVRMGWRRAPDWLRLHAD